MDFIIYQCAADPDYFVVTDAAHESKLPQTAGPSKSELKRVGTFAEMGKERRAFDERLARNAIDTQGYYLFEATSFAPVPEAPEMPG